LSSSAWHRKHNSYCLPKLVLFLNQQSWKYFLNSEPLYCSRRTPPFRFDNLLLNSVDWFPLFSRENNTLSAKSLITIINANRNLLLQLLWSRSYVIELVFTSSTRSSRRANGDRHHVITLFVFPVWRCDCERINKNKFCVWNLT